MFRSFFEEVRPIRLQEPLAELLGAFAGDGGVIEYTFTDVVKMAGHACPTVASAYVCCQEALGRLYPGDELPVRGEVAVSVWGEPDDGVYGVMAQVFGFITGAAPNTGFRGMGRRFRRKDLLRFDAERGGSGGEGMTFELCRQDNGRTVLAHIRPGAGMLAGERMQRMSELLTSVLWDAANPDEARELQDLWMERVRDIAVGRRDLESWLEIKVTKGETT